MLCICLSIDLGVFGPLIMTFRHGGSTCRYTTSSIATRSLKVNDSPSASLRCISVSSLSFARPTHSVNQSTMLYARAGYSLE